MNLGIISAVLKKYWIALGLLLLGLLILSIPVWTVWSYFKIGSSGANLSLVGQSVLARFSWSVSDRSNISQIASRIKLLWDGQDFAFSIGSAHLGELSKILPANFAINAPSQNELDLWGSASFLPSGPLATLSAGDSFVPADAVAIANITGLQRQYNLPGKEVFNYVSEFGTIGAVIKDDKFGLIFVSDIKDQPGLNKTLVSLKDQQVQPVVGYSGTEAPAAGFSEQIQDGDKIYVLTQPGLIYQPTFGVVDNKFLAATSPEVWRMAKQAHRLQQTITSEARYQQAMVGLPAVSVGKLYLDMPALTARGDKLSTDLEPFVKLNFSRDLAGYGIDWSRVASISASWVSLSLSGGAFPGRMFLKVLVN